MGGGASARGRLLHGAEAEAAQLRAALQQAHAAHAEVARPILAARPTLLLSQPSLPARLARGWPRPGAALGLLLPLRGPVGGRIRPKRAPW